MTGNCVMQAAQLLHLRDFPDSLWPPPYYHTVGDKPLIECFLDWLQGAGQLHNLWIVGHSPRDSEHLRELASAKRARFHAMPAAGELVCSSEVLRLSGTDTLEVLSWGIMLLPDSYLSKLRSLYETSACDLAEGARLPANASALVISARLIELMLKIPSLRADADVRSSVCRLKKSVLWPRPTQTSAPFRDATIDFPAAYACDPSELPQEFGFRLLDDRLLTFRSMSRRSELTSDRAVLDMLAQHKSARTAILQQNYSGVLQKHSPQADPNEPDREKPLCVLYAANACAYSGSEESLFRMISGFSPAQVEAHAILSQGGVFQERLEDIGTRVDVFGADFAQPSIATVRRLEARIAKISPDVLHLNSVCGRAILLAAQRLGVPIVQHLRTPDVGELGDALYSAHRLVAVSRFLENIVRGYDVNPSRVAVIYDGVDTSHFHPAAIARRVARRRLGIDDDSKVILGIARFTRNKRHDLLVRAFHAVVARVPQAQLLLVGEGTGDHGYLAEVTSLIEDFGLTERVRFLGYQKEIRVAETAADVQVLCSEQESLGTGILESMALGVPVVITDGGGLAEVIEDGVNGFVTPRGNYVQVASRVIDILNDDNLWMKISGSARLTIESRFTIQHCAQAMLCLYREVLA